jgi:organic radical activating enzyme
MEINKTTFCAAPWFQIRQNRGGSYTSCCAIDHSCTNYKNQTSYESPTDWLNSEYLQYLRKNLTSGTKLPECHKCWKAEENNLASLRSHMNNTVTDNVSYEKSWLPFYFKNKTDYTNNLLLSADITTSFVCNFSCAMCNPGASSKIYTIWGKDKTHPLVKDYLEQNPGYLDNIGYIYKEGKSYKFLKEILEHKPQHLKLLGGEPLLDQYLIECLESYNFKGKTSLTFVTNGSVDLTEVHTRLSAFKTISFVISLENIEKVQDYVRRGSDWDQIETNILKYINNYSSKNLYVHTTLQALTISRLPDLIHWTSKNNIRLGCGILYRPEYLSFNAMPPKFFAKVCTNLKNSGAVLNRIDGEIITETSMIDFVNLISKDYVFDQTQQDNLKIFLDWYDPDQQWKHILPEWLDVFPD